MMPEPAVPCICPGVAVAQRVCRYRRRSGASGRPGTASAGAGADRIREKRRVMKGLRRISGVIVGTACVAVLSGGAAAAETFTATGTVKTAGGATATAPITVTVDRTMTQAEVDGLTAAFKAGGAAGLRKALAVWRRPVRSRWPAARRRRRGSPSSDPRTRDGSSPSSPTRRSFTSAPVFRVRSRRKAMTSPSWISKSRRGGGGSGTLTPAARLGLKGGAFVVDGLFLGAGAADRRRGEEVGQACSWQILSLT